MILRGQPLSLQPNVDSNSNLGSGKNIHTTRCAVVAPTVAAQQAVAKLAANISNINTFNSIDNNQIEWR